MTTRQQLGQRFRDSSAGSPWKTFVLEVHPDGQASDQVLRDAFGPDQVHGTEDAFMHAIRLDDAEVVVDHLDARFWSFHSEARVDQVLPVLKETIEGRRDFDWMWIPSQHLRGALPGSRATWVKSNFRGRRLLPSKVRVQDLEVQLRGSAADEVLGLIQGKYSEAISFDQVAATAIDPTMGSVQEGVSRQGRFIARGDSFEFHQELVSGVVSRYRQLVDLVEARTIVWEPLEHGGIALNGSPIVIQFSRPIPDRDLFTEQLFSCREPFRLWGVPREHDGQIEVEAVDLHVGQRVRFDIGSDWLRVYIFEGGCGNTVARLITNLQHYFDGALRLLDPALQAALELSEPTK